jgi:hypothetical protein
MKSHITVVGILFIFFGVMGLFGACCLLLVLIGPGLIPLFAEGEGIPALILTTLAIILATMAVLFSIPDLIAGIGIIQMRPWARILGLILAVLSLINLAAFPLSTIFGVYALWVLLKDESVALFESEEPCC